MSILQTQNIVDYNDLANEVVALLSEREGRDVDIRDYADKFNGEVKDVPYIDFWHYWINNISDVYNNSLLEMHCWNEVYSVCMYHLNSDMENAEPNNLIILKGYANILNAFNEVLKKNLTEELLDTEFLIRYAF